MPNTLLTFEVEDRRARAAFSRLKREVDSLENEFNTTRSEAREAGAAIDALAIDHAPRQETLTGSAIKHNRVQRR